MKLLALAQLLSPRDIRNGLLGLAVTLGGLGLALFTLYAHRSQQPQLAGIAAAASLVFVLLILIFVVPPLARNASKEASQMNLPFEITTGGAIFLGLLVIVGFSAWNTGNNLLFLVLSLLSSAFVVSFFAGKACLKKLDVKMRFPETIYAGEITPILVNLSNRKFFFPTVSVTAEVRGKEREKSLVLDELKQILPAKWAEKIARPPIIKHTLDYFMHISRRGASEKRTEHIFPNRGRFIIKDFELSTKFPFGFFRHRRRLPAQEVELIIFPQVEKIDAETQNLPLDMGKLSINKRGAGQDLLSLREYQPTDDFRQINWKATARTQRLTVSEFASEDEKRMTIFFDTRLEKENSGLSLRQRIEAEQNGNFQGPAWERFENGVRLAASLLSSFADEQAEVRLIINGEKGSFGLGRPHLIECLKRLALALPDHSGGNGGYDELWRENSPKRQNSHLFVVTAEEAGKLPAEILQNAAISKY